jgi:hypothetical protein
MIHKPCSGGKHTASPSDPPTPPAQILKTLSPPTHLRKLERSRGASNGAKELRQKNVGGQAASSCKRARKIDDRGWGCKNKLAMHAITALSTTGR